MSITNSPKNSLPAYIDFIYGHIYKDPVKMVSMDNDIRCSLKTFFQYKKLVNSVVKELKMNQSVLQLGVVFGSQIDETAMAVGAYGQYDVVDINQYQVSRINEKYWKVYQGLKVFKQDAANLKLSNNYDAVVCFMLLSEVPSLTKRKIVNNALKMVKPGGKVIFADWHNPLKYHPLRYIVRMYNRLYHPFVERLWDRDIDTYAEPELRGKFIWRKNTYFGRMFQKTIAVRKEDPSYIANNLENNSDIGFGLADF